MSDTMADSCCSDSLKKFAKVIESLDVQKRIAAAKWLEGVVVGQALTPKERESIVNAVNEYIADIDEEEYAIAVNVLIEYLHEIQACDDDSIIAYMHNWL